MKTELDPTGRLPGEPGAKLDSGKVRVDLLLDGMPSARQVGAGMGAVVGKVGDG